MEKEEHPLVTAGGMLGEKEINEFMGEFLKTSNGQHLKEWVESQEKEEECICSEEEKRSYKLERFGDGEWMGEPDFIRANYRGIICHIVRNALGALCGYVEVPVSHEWHGRTYDDIECDVHGGLTFGEEMEIPETKEKRYVIGFDCAHSMDYSPSLEKMMGEQRDRPEHARLKELELKFKDAHLNLFKRTYKNIAFVKGEIERLVDQMLDGMADEKPSKCNQGADL